jgi:hypothetical protein
VHQADWIGPRLAPWEGGYTVTIVVGVRSVGLIDAGVADCRRR